MQWAWVGLGLCVGSYLSDVGMAAEFDGLFMCTGETHQQECLSVIPAIRACSRNVLALMEDLLRGWVLPNLQVSSVLCLSNCSGLQLPFSQSSCLSVSMKADKVQAWQVPWDLWQQKKGSCFPRWHFWNACGILETGRDIHEAAGNVFCLVSMPWL